MNSSELPKRKPNPPADVRAGSGFADHRVERMSTSGWPLFLYLPPVYKDRVLAAIETAERAFESLYVPTADSRQFQVLIKNFLFSAVTGFVSTACDAFNANLLTFDHARDLRESFLHDLVDRLDRAKCKSNHFLLDFNFKLRHDLRSEIEKLPGWRLLEDTLLRRNESESTGSGSTHRPSEEKIRGLSATERDLEMKDALVELIDGPQKEIQESFLRESLSREFGIKPEDVSLRQLREGMVHLIRRYPALTLIPSLDSTLPSIQEIRNGQRVDPDLERDPEFTQETELEKKSLTWSIVTGVEDPQGRQLEVNQFERVCKRALSVTKQPLTNAEWAIDKWLDFLSTEITAGKLIKRVCLESRNLCCELSIRATKGKDSEKAELLKEIAQRFFELRGDGHGWIAFRLNADQPVEDRDESSSHDKPEEQQAALVRQRQPLLAEYQSATGMPSKRSIYNAKNSGIHKPEFYDWLNGKLSCDSETAKNFERFLREKKKPIPRERKG